MPQSREEDFLKKYTNFTLFIPNITSSSDKGLWNLQFVVSLPYICYILKIDPVVLEKYV